MVKHLLGAWYARSPEFDPSTTKTKEKIFFLTITMSLHTSQFLHLSDFFPPELGIESGISCLVGKRSTFKQCFRPNFFIYIYVFGVFTTGLQA
jgi:hypothetical protein